MLPLLDVAGLRETCAAHVGAGRRPDEFENEPLFNVIGELAEPAGALAPVGVRQSSQCFVGSYGVQAGATRVASRSATLSISSLVVPRPRLKRIAPMLTSGATRMALRTGDSST